MTIAKNKIFLLGYNMKIVILLFSGGINLSWGEIIVWWEGVYWGDFSSWGRMSKF